MHFRACFAVGRLLHPSCSMAATVPAKQPNWKRSQ
ncbi:hypothetical protein CGRA01v4_06612 [Colletotrichum graminicola]|nr:hypothetical protein CGRA01v4_06612 [Colletotrichum graminicola]